ncbi:MAG: polysaccharide deacetylase family protein [Planctomycetota bacterium]
MRKEPFSVILSFDMETDLGSYTADHEGIERGTPPLLDVLKAGAVPATFFFTGDVADKCPQVVRRVAKEGYEIGCHGLYHETLGDPMFALPYNNPVLQEEVEGRLSEGTRRVKKACGKKPVSFRCPRLWGSTRVVKALDKLGYAADSSFPLFRYLEPFVPYHPSVRDWRKRGRMRIVEIPLFCDLAAQSKDPMGRDRDQWPLFRTKGHRFVMRMVESFLGVVRSKGKTPVVCLYFHSWDFLAMPKGAIRCGEANVIPDAWLVKNTGAHALAQLDRLIDALKHKGAQFLTCKELARQY